MLNLILCVSNRIAARESLSIFKDFQKSKVIKIKAVVSDKSFHENAENILKCKLSFIENNSKKENRILNRQYCKD